MANPSRKEAQDNAKKKRTSTRKKKDTTPTPTPTTGTIPTTGTTPKRGRRGGGITGGGTGGGGGISSGGNNRGNIQVLDVNSVATSDPYSVLPGIPEMSKKDSLKIQMSLVKQQNALDVRYERAKTLRKALKTATEEQNAVTDYINYESAVVGTETAAINYQSTVTDRDIASSKLEQKQEQYIQQQNATAHTIAMTPLLQQEHDLNLTKQELKNEKLSTDLAQTRSEIRLKQSEVEAMVTDI